MISISVIIVTQGPKEHLIKCLSSLRQLPRDCELILIGNGVVLDESVKSSLNDYFTHTKVIESQEKISPGEARNLALAQVGDTEWIYFIDEKASMEEGYWEKVEPLLTKKEMDVIGGPSIAAPDLGYFSEAVATVMTSPFCTGLTFSRHYPLGKKIQFASEENLSLVNLWVRKNLFSLISFPGKYAKGEESLVLAKFSEKGFGLYYHPKLRVSRLWPTNLNEVLKESFLGGYYRSLLMKEKVDFSWSYYLPSVFILLHLSLFLDFTSFLELAKIYVLLIACISLGISQRQGTLKTAPVVFFLHYVIVVTYGFGFMAARIYNPTKKS
ncbi:MAG TPA: glycosyltransferase [Bacteriovoracaceae bacterium]|nr:glycosyltransferase [Bacteriovoracaceae bacterium]